MKNCFLIPWKHYVLTETVQTNIGLMASCITVNIKILSWFINDCSCM